MLAPTARAGLVNPWWMEARACLALSWPLVVTNAIEMAMNLTSVAMIARVGPHELAASTLAIALYTLMLLFGIGVLATVPAMIAREAGRPRPDEHAIRRVVHQGLWGALLISVPAWLVLWNAAPLFRALGQDAALSETAAGYLRTLQWALLPTLAYIALRSLFAALERPRAAVVTGVAAVLLNAALNALLIGGWGAVPALGLPGSGLATLGANIFLVAALGLVALLHPRTRRLRLLTGLARPPLGGFAAFWRLGLPIGVSVVLEAGMFAGGAALVGIADPEALAAHAVALQVASFTFMVPLGVAQAATVRVGRALGGGDRRAAQRAGHTALALGIGVMALSATMLVLAPRFFAELFLDPAAPGAAHALDVAIVLLGIAGLFQVADGAQVVLAGMLRGLQDARAPMVISAVGYWGVGIPLAAALAFGLDLGAPGVWIGLTAGLFAVAALLFGRWRVLMRSAGLPRERNVPA